MNAPDIAFIRQHLIDPEVCIRCNTCEETCPVDAITHDSRNYVVDPEICNGCNACISPCPTGSIDHWHVVPRAAAYTLERAVRLGRTAAAAGRGARRRGDAAVGCRRERWRAGADGSEAPQANAAVSPTSAAPPWSAAHPYLNLLRA